MDESNSQMTQQLARVARTLQVFLLTPEVSSYKGSDRESMERADDDGFHPLAQVDDSEGSETS